MKQICESCGMPMSKDPNPRENERYCSYCYADGKFTFEGTVKEFQEFCRKKMVEGGMPRFTAWLFSRGMKRLPRWKNA